MSPEFSIWTLTIAAAASCLVSGVFLSFSDFTMRSLRLATPKAGSQAMQILNREVFRSIFIVLLVGMSPIAALIGVWGWFWPPVAGTSPMTIGSVCYVFGVFAVTMFGNVPKNDKLAKIPDGSAEAQAYWPTYYAGWMFWNHIRTGFALMAALCFLSAAFQIALAN